MLESRLIESITAFRGRLVESVVAGCVGYAEHGEPGIALEVLCDNLEDYEVEITNGEHVELLKFANEMKYPEERFEFLEELVRSSEA